MKSGRDLGRGHKKEKVSKIEKLGKRKRLVLKNRLRIAEGGR